MGDKTSNRDILRQYRLAIFNICINRETSKGLVVFIYSTEIYVEWENAKGAHNSGFKGHFVCEKVS